ncbi:MAG: hypothetical protein ACE5HT_11530 [Gemmatimonadales bacterium]
MTAPISVERFLEELDKLGTEMKSGNLEHGEYDQRLARIIHELRERGIDAERSEIIASLEDALERKVITPTVKNHILHRLGLV